ncbi:MAG TPA: head GIN domain-containing protein [Gammaproteobacteria bacterium]|nr:head GIN domain-containing protein [Gammaproteobacteria bacterium]
MTAFGRVSFSALIFILFSLNTANADEIKKEKRQIADFTKIVISGAGHLFLKQGENVALTIETERTFLPELKSEVIDQVLYLGLKEPKTFVSQSNPPINYYLTLTNIEDIHTEGSIEISSKGTISAKELNLVTAGAGIINLKIKTDSLKTQVEGNSNIALSGTATTQTLKIEGTGKIQGKKLLTKTTHVNIKGAGIAEVNASETLAVKIEGVGTVKYYGEPKITQEISGAGEIIPLE